MDVQAVSDTVLLLGLVCPTDLPNIPTQPGISIEEQRQKYPTRPPFPKRPEGSTKEALSASLLKPSFLFSSLANKQLFSSQLLSGLSIREAANHSSDSIHKS